MIKKNYLINYELKKIKFASLPRDIQRQSKQRSAAILQRGISAFAQTWSNQQSYTGDGLMIPFRIETGHFTQAEADRIKDTLEKLSRWLSDCITFLDDSESLLYPKQGSA